MTPSRMKSWRAIDAAMNSIAQQARPKLNTQRRVAAAPVEDHLASARGARPRAARAGSVGIGSGRSASAPSPRHDPPQQPAARGVQQADGEEAEEDEHLDERRRAEPGAAKTVAHGNR